LMCDLCIVENTTICYGEPIPNYKLVKATANSCLLKAGQYGLVSKYTVVLCWDIEPAIDPTDGLSEDEVNNFLSADNGWALEHVFLSRAQQFEKSLMLSPCIGYELFAACIAAGYVATDGDLCYWLFNRISRLIVKDGCI